MMIKVLCVHIVVSKHKGYTHKPTRTALALFPTACPSAFNSFAMINICRSRVSNESVPSVLCFSVEMEDEEDSEQLPFSASSSPAATRVATSLRIALDSSNTFWDSCVGGGGGLCVCVVTVAEYVNFMGL